MLRVQRCNLSTWKSEASRNGCKTSTAWHSRNVSRAFLALCTTLCNVPSMLWTNVCLISWNSLKFSGDKNLESRCANMSLWSWSCIICSHSSLLLSLMFQITCNMSTHHYSPLFTIIHHYSSYSTTHIIFY